MVPMSMTSTGVGATLFAVGVAKLPPVAAEDRQRQVAIFRDALMRNISGRVTHAAPAKLNLASGDARTLLASEAIEASGRDAQGRAVRLTARFFIVDGRLYQVVALGGEGEIPPEVLDTFFTSFRLAAN